MPRKKHVIDFNTGKEPKMNFFDFGAFQDFRAKYILHKLFREFQGTSRNDIQLLTNILGENGRILQGIP